MSRLAFVFPGQGSQAVGMGARLAAASPAAAAVFAAADAALGEPITKIAHEGPEDLLNQTEYAQPALLAASIAVLEALRERWASLGIEPPTPAYVAGHSMGQYSALVAAGALDLADAIRLVRERGRLMQRSGDGRPGRMAAIIGLDEGRLPEVLARAAEQGVVGVANRNAPGQVVVSGEAAAVAVASRLAKELGAKRVVELPVSVAAHSPLMAEAAEGMRRALAAVAFRDPHPPLLANADARPITTAADARAELVEHLTTGVDWIAAVERMAAEGVTTFVEVGPGRVLSGLIRRIAPEATVLATDDPNADDGLAVPFAERVAT
ncbi:MAG TPA: ACP S-malonyltransferase [Candidatus Binatia bacterium]|nr:ACP S-malonyltransferase [Candidatus Binatia bacterium]